MRHVPQNILEDVARGVRVALVAAHQPRIEVEIHQLGVVIQHLLEMRHEPFGVHGITREAAADLIVNSARGHVVAG